MPEVYVTADELLAAWPGLADLPEDEQARRVDYANGVVRDALGRDILLGERTETHAGTARGTLYLRVYPVASVSAVTINGRALDNTGSDAWTLDADPNTGMLFLGRAYGDPAFGPWYPRGRANVAVTYTGGYATVPPAVKQAAILAARSLAIDPAMTASGPYKSETIGDYSYTLGDGGASSVAGSIQQEIRRLLRPYAVSGLG